jgi:hypothetical protein
VAEEINFDYKSGSEPSGGEGVEHISWTASEYIEHKRGSGWYFILTIGTFGLAAIIYGLTRDLFAVVITVILGAIVASVAHRKPRQLTYELTRQGINVGEKHYSYREFKSFAIVQEGPLSSLVLIPLKRFAAALTIFFEKNDEANITAVLGEHLPMEQRSPDKVDTLSRRLRF